MVKRLISLILMIAALHFAAQAQFDVVTVSLDATTNGTSGQLSGTTQYFVSDNGSGSHGEYSSGIDYTYTVYGTCTSPNVLSLYVDVDELSQTVSPQSPAFCRR